MTAEDWDGVFHARIFREWDELGYADDVKARIFTRTPSAGCRRCGGPQRPCAAQQARLHQTADLREAVAALFDTLPPHFRGR
jgi:hypothetical protein